MVTFSAPLSGLGAFSQGMGVVSHNVANVNTDNFRSGRTTFQESSTGLGVEASSTFPSKSSLENVVPSDTEYAREAVNLITYQRGFEANVVSIQTADSMLGSVLDMKV